VTADLSSKILVDYVIFRVIFRGKKEVEKQPKVGETVASVEGQGNMEMTSKKIQEWQKRIKKIREDLSQLGDMRPGSLSEQYNVCGNPTCRCKDPKNPQKHGPYHQLSYTHKGKSTTEFVKKDKVAEMKRHIRNYRTFKKLTDEWVDLSVQIGKMRKKTSDS